uniref:Uncharacterized protein n=1 Tax=Ceratitis capitata TaxID=7213 RepID=W8BX44_CERCA
MKSLMILLGIYASITAVLSIECYDCESMSDPRCNQYFEPEGVKQTDCDDGDMPEYLHKYERRIKATGCLTKVHEGLDGRRYYIRRACYYGDPENTAEACETPDSYIPFVNIISCTVCTEDLCNVNAELNGGHHAMDYFSKLTLVVATVAALILNNV